MIETRKAHELDVVELVEDLPEYGLKRGERGTVVEVFDEPEEAYMLEFVEHDGTSSRLADWVKPSQVINLKTTVVDILERGIRLFNEGNSLEAEKVFRQAVGMMPECLDVLHHSIMKDLADSGDYSQLIMALRLMLRINSNYETARNNLAIAFQRYGIQQEAEGHYDESLELLHLALGVDSAEDVTASIKRSFAVVYTSLGLKAFYAGDPLKAWGYMRKACEADPNQITRRNLSVAYVHTALYYFNHADLPQALEGFERAQDMGLITPALLNNYGVALARQGRGEEAIFEFERGLKIDPGNHLIESNLSRVLNMADPHLNSAEINIEYASIPSVPSQEFRMAA